MVRTTFTGRKYIALALSLLLLVLPNACASSVASEPDTILESVPQEFYPAKACEDLAVTPEPAPAPSPIPYDTAEPEETTISQTPSPAPYPITTLSTSGKSSLPETNTVPKPSPLPAPPATPAPSPAQPKKNPSPALASSSPAPQRVLTPMPVQRNTQAPVPAMTQAQTQRQTTSSNSASTKSFSRGIVSIGAIKQNPAAYEGQYVELSGTYRGWQGELGPPPVTRSDWILQDGTGSIYVTGGSLGLKYPADVGKAISLSGVVKLKNGQPYLNITKIDVHFINVGQGDSILIDYGETEVLIDGGDSRLTERMTYLKTYLSRYIDGPLEVMVATHPDIDHIGGLIGVLNDYNVQQIWHNGDTNDTQAYTRFMTAVSTEGAQVHIGKRGDRINAGGLSFILLNPFSNGGEVDNEDSIVMSFGYGKVDFLFTGDAGNVAEGKMLSDTEISVPDIEILKVGHHGSSTSSSPNFLRRTTPEIAIYMAGLNNSYGHPTTQTITALNNIGAKIYGTDKNGTIVVTTDGNTYSVRTEK